MIRPGNVPLLGALLLSLMFMADAAAVHAGITQRLDGAILAALRQVGDDHRLLGPAWGLPVTVAVTVLGGGLVRAPLAIVGTVLLLFERRRGDAFLLGGAVASGAAALPLLKMLADRARPDLAWRLVTEAHASFPSGHAMGSMILYPLIGLLFGRSRGWVVAGICVALAVGVTRVLLGVHWASDVLGGWLLGGAWALAACCFRRDRD